MQSSRRIATYAWSYTLQETCLRWIALALVTRKFPCQRMVPCATAALHAVAGAVSNLKSSFLVHTDLWRRDLLTTE